MKLQIKFYEGVEYSLSSSHRSYKLNTFLFTFKLIVNVSVILSSIVLVSIKVCIVLTKETY